MRILQQLILIFLLSCTAVTSSFSQAIKLEVNVDQQTIYADEVIHFTYTVDGIEGAFESVGPQANDFHIIGQPTQSSFTRITNINGRVKQELNTQITYTLKPKKTGTITVQGGGIKDEKGQFYAAKKIQIKVLPGKRPATARNPIEDEFDAIRQAQQQMVDFLNGHQDPFSQEPEPQSNAADFLVNKLNDNLFIKAEIDKTNPYIGEQVNIIYKLYSRVIMNMRPLNMPQLNGFWAQDEDIVDIGTAHQENYNGQKYDVFTLRSSALFPQRAGKLHIDPIKAGGWVLVTEATDYGGYREKRIDKEIESPTQVIQVKPLPSTNLPFSGGVGRFQINAEISQNNGNTNDVFVLTLQIHGRGNLGLISAPKFNVPEGLNILGPETKDQIQEIKPQLSGTKTFSYNITADKAGNFQIPAIEFVYFDVLEQSYKTLSTSAIELNIQAGKQSNANEYNAKNQSLAGPIKSVNKLNTSSLNKNWLWLLLSLLPWLIWAMKKLSPKLKGKQKAMGGSKEQQASPSMLVSDIPFDEAYYVHLYQTVSQVLQSKLGVDIDQVPLENLRNNLLAKGLAPEYLQDLLSLKNLKEMSFYSPLNPEIDQHWTLKTQALIDQLNQLNDE